MYSFLKVVVGAIFNLLYKINVIGNNEVNNNQSFIFAANHMNVIDPILVGITSKNKPIHFIAKKELFENKFLAWLLNSVYAIPINRQKMDFRAMKSAFDVLKNNQILGIFPEGTRVKENQNIDAKNGIGMFAVRAGVPVIPITIVPHNNYKLFSRIDVIYGDTYEIPENLSEKNAENYETISKNIMDIIHENKKRV